MSICVRTSQKPRQIFFAVYSDPSYPQTVAVVSMREEVARFQGRRCAIPIETCTYSLSSWISNNNTSEKSHSNWYEQVPCTLRKGPASAGPRNGGASERKSAKFVAKPPFCWCHPSNRRLEPPLSLSSEVSILLYHNFTEIIMSSVTRWLTFPRIDRTYLHFHIVQAHVCNVRSWSTGLTFHNR